jgi:hypothetical protein
LRFPRINRWRKDKTANEINTLDDLKKNAGTLWEMSVFRFEILKFDIWFLEF